MKSLVVISSFAVVAFASSASQAQAVGGSIEVTTPPPPQAQVIVETPQQPPPQYYGQQPVYVQPGYAQPVYGQPYYGGRRAYARPYLGGPIPPGTHVESHPSYGLIAGGAALFGAAWLPMVFFLGVNGLEYLSIPVAGPFIGAAVEAGTNDPFAGVVIVFGIIDGLAQIGGIAMFTLGILNPRRTLVTDYALHTPRVQPLRWALLPGVHGAAGMAPGATLSIVNF